MVKGLRSEYNHDEMNGGIMTDESITTVEEPLVAPKPRKALSLYAVVSFIAGIGTYVWFFAMVKQETLLAFLLVPIFALIAVFTGHKAKHDIRKSLSDMKGKTLANIGLILGYFIVLLGVFTIVLAIMGALTAISALFGG